MPNDNLKNSILRWFANGQTGISSKAMASAILDIELTGWQQHNNHPHDPDDLNRCLLFLAVVPGARQYLDKVRKLSAIWDRLIEHWDEVEQAFIDEVGFNWSNGTRAPKTYALMQQVIDGQG
jgi:hypothetical protein